MAISTNMTISESFGQMTDQLSSRATTLKTSIQAALKDGDLDPMKMLQLQFDMGNYNAMVEATSSVTKGLTDTAKTLAQRAGG
ncbi:EscF/YscF/HrpA family type III secretion system needle major subunit [Desulfocurvus vexinensis]|jgi:type III secretion protein F|uniref:EscF/YscF/HrpA family type III secretion system needle major subunit n=1 Tax=Desulfocurvus vexinensis TaxID=399548 RepID=UPI0004ACF0F1|nr:EscF/YscF/HrpA family type III secretion system needle major subunit [Desulfocurvus vexinensis]